MKHADPMVMTHRMFLVQLPGQPGHYVRYDQHSPRSAEVVAHPLHATSFWTENDARGHVGYGDFFLKPKDRVPGESPIVETRGAHIVRLTLTGTVKPGPLAAPTEGTWLLEDLGP